MSYFIISIINWVVFGILIIITIEPHMITATTSLIETTGWKNNGSSISQVNSNTWIWISVNYVLLLNVPTLFRITNIVETLLQNNKKSIEQPVLDLSPYPYLQELNGKVLHENRMIFGNHSGIQIFNGNNSIMVLQMVISPASTFSKVFLLSSLNYSSTRFFLFFFYFL